MKIGIIGAGIAGLAAGRELAEAGHDVTVIEKNRMLGGRLATFRGGMNSNLNLDFGTSFFTAKSPEFSGFVSELLDKELVKVWGDRFPRYDGEKLLDRNPNWADQVKYAAPEGMQRIVKYLSRWVDIRSSERAGGLTYLGANRGRKRAWMINLTNFNTFEADAVIIATPAPEAYGILLTSQDEVGILKLIREIDEVHYQPSYALMAAYGDIRAPEWDAVSCNDPVIHYISNEKSKRAELPETALVMQSTAGFAQNQIRKQQEPDHQLIADKMLEHAGPIAGRWAASPIWTRVHEWRFVRPGITLKRPWMEFESEESPLAIAGDYFDENERGGDEMDRAYRSGLSLARHWIKKYEKRVYQLTS